MINVWKAWNGESSLWLRLHNEGFELIVCKVILRCFCIAWVFHNFNVPYAQSASREYRFFLNTDYVKKSSVIMCFWMHYLRILVDLCVNRDTSVFDSNWFVRLVYRIPYLCLVGWHILWWSTTHDFFVWALHMDNFLGYHRSSLRLFVLFDSYINNDIIRLNF